MIERVIQDLEITSELLIKIYFIDGLGPVSVEKILTGLTLTEREKKLLASGRDNKVILEQVSRERELCAQNNIKIITRLDPEYPDILRETPAAPFVLWVRGNFSDLKNLVGIGVVGARDADSYGKQATERIVDSLGPEAIVISGGARGVDSCAHRRALANGQKTVVIIGSGQAYSYPAENKKLFDKIASDDNGLIISPFSYFTKPDRKNFPIRNRIIAGLSEKIIVVQAKEKSGGLITAQYALAYNRDVAAVPGRITDELSLGTNKLLQAGAEVYIPDYREVTDHVNLSESQSDSERVLLFLQSPRRLDEISEHCKLSQEKLGLLLAELETQARVSQNYLGQWECV